MRFGIRIPSITKRIAARLSIKRYIRHTLGMKAPMGLGWITNPKRALYNRIYTRTTRGGMAYLPLFLGFMVMLLLGCDVKSKQTRKGKAVYVKPSVDYRGRYRKGHIRMPVSTDKNAVRNQARSRYYYETRGKYRRKK